MCNEIGMTEQGFKRAFDNYSIKVKTMKDIARVLNIPLFELFTDELSGKGNYAGRDNTSIQANNSPFFNQSNPSENLTQVREVEKKLYDCQQKVIDLQNKIIDMQVKKK